jgi:PTS system fructose-specific IIC component
MLSLESCFEPSHILPALESKTKTAVVGELAAHAQQLGLVRDEEWFVGALIKRENVMPSAPGNGLAFLHTLRRHPEQIAKPFMVLGRSRLGIDFDALDGKATHLFFVLGLRYDELHLPWLAKLVQMLAQPDVLPSLMKARDARALYERLAEAERKLAPSAAAAR